MTDLRQAAQAVIDRWDSPLWKNGSTADAIADLRTALEQQAEPSQWRDMVVVTLVREGVNKHKARELADHFAAPPQQQAEPPQEPFGYFRAEPFGWTDCAETDEGAVALYERPPQHKPLTVQEIAAFVGTHQYGPEQLKWFRLGEAAHGIKEGT